jgi:glutamate---cysteine ligase / carboxylate-amine ligase
MSLYRIGIEEEFFVTDLGTRNVRCSMSKKFFRACKDQLGDTVKSELLQSQIEALTPPCGSLAEARGFLANSRTTIATVAEQFGLGIVASGTHPLAIWLRQKPTSTPRYDVVMSDLQMLGRRNMLCGLHVHVEILEPDRRVDIMYRAIPFLPVLLALSASSPFWRGQPTGLLGYRLAAYDELPRTGLPEPFRTSDEYQCYVDTLAAAGVIPDASYIWWAIRPSLQYPTIELRIADACTRLDDALCIAAIFQCLVRHLSEHPELNADFDSIARAITEENKWRAQRYGVGASFVDPRSREAKPLTAIVGELLELLQADATVLHCLEEVRYAAEIVKRGSSADDQLRVFRQARANGQSRLEALRAVIDWLIQETIRFDDKVNCRAAS